MKEIVARQFSPDDLEPELVRLVTPIARRWEAAALRVAAHHADPKKFALPADPNAPEMILAPRFNTIAKARPDRAKSAGVSAVDRLQVPKTQRKLKKVINIDFSDASKSVDVLVKPPASEISKNALLRLVDRKYAQLGVQRTTQGEPPPPQKTVSMSLIRVVCIDETNGFLGSEAGEDEIAMSGLTLDQSATEGLIAPFTVADDFDDGNRVDFSPAKRLFAMAVAGGASYPKHYFATLLMFEKDQGDLNETMEKVLRKFADEVAAKVAAWLGGKVGTIFGGPLGTAAGALVGYLVGWLVGKFVNRMIAVWEDDPFNPRTLELIIPSATAPFNQPSLVFHFTGPGEYAVRYRWTVS
jgi:hypothetical protein